MASQKSLSAERYDQRASTNNRKAREACIGALRCIESSAGEPPTNSLSWFTVFTPFFREHMWALTALISEPSVIRVNTIDVANGID